MRRVKASIEQLWRDDRHWPLGPGLYWCPDDPRVFVPHRTMRIGPWPYWVPNVSRLWLFGLWFIGYMGLMVFWVFGVGLWLCRNGWLNDGTKHMLTIGGVAMFPVYLIALVRRSQMAALEPAS